MLSIWKKKLRAELLRQEEPAQGSATDAQSSATNSHPPASTPSPTSVLRLLDAVKHSTTLVTTSTPRDQLELCLLAIVGAHQKQSSGQLHPGSILVVLAEKTLALASSIEEHIMAKLGTTPLLVTELQQLNDANPILIGSLFCLQQSLEERTLQPSKISVIILLIPELQVHKTLGDLLDADSTLNYLVISVRSPEVWPTNPFALASSVPRKPTELVILYEVVPPNGKVKHLHQQLQNLESIHLGKHLERASVLLHSLGEFATGNMWIKLLDGGEINQLPGARIIKDFKFDRTVVKRVEDRNISSRVATLLDLLEAQLQVSRDAKFVIWVRQSYIAHALREILLKCKIEDTYLHPTVIDGHNSIGSQEPDDLIEKFLAGTFNILIASASTDDLALPPASCVIRFDIADSLVSYANSLACAGPPTTYLISLAERDNGEHRRVLNRMAALDSRVRRWLAMACTASSAHPPSSFFEPTIAHHTLDEPVAKYIKDPTTSRRIYESDALHIVYQMASKLDIGGNRDRTPDPMFVFEVAKLNGSLVYSCELSMSSSSNSQCFKGTPCHSTSSARRAACFQLCDSLFQRGNLDYRLFPSIDQTRQPFSSIASVVDATHNGSSRIDRLYRRKHSEFWSNCLTSPQGKLYVTIITISMEATSSFHSLLLLTRCALPPISPINFHFLGALGEARMRQIGFLEITTALEETLRAYTQRLLRLVTNKVIEDKGQGVDYLLAPAHKTGGSQINAISSKLPVEGQGCPIDWESVHNHASTPNVAVPLCGERGSNVNLHAIIHDCMVQDRPTEFTRRYEVRRVCTTLSVNSVIPENAGGNGSFTFLDELKARANFSGVRDSNQPMLETRRFQPPFNHLSPTTKEYEGGETKYFVPELSYRLIIPASVMRTASLLPSLLRRLDDMLLVKELNASLSEHRLDETLLHHAITSSTAMMEFDYERLELLGDAYLKYLSSVLLFVSAPYQNEGVMHLLRQKLISNQTLFESAVRSGIPAYAQTRKLVAKHWRHWNHLADERNDNLAEPSNINRTEENEKLKKTKRKHNEDAEHHLNDKGIADIAEAIIGAAFLSHGNEEALQIAKRISIPFPSSLTWVELGRQASSITPPTTLTPLPQMSLKKIEETIGHTFNKPLLLAQALTQHTIHKHCGTASCFERLEFVGDAVLDFLCVNYIYGAHPDASPGTLTLLKNAMVSNSTLAAICVHLGLHDLLIVPSNHTKKEIESYVNSLRRYRETSYAIRNHSQRVQYWLDLDPPKALGDVVESIFGALLVDEGARNDAFERFFHKALVPFYNKHIDINTLSQPPVNLLHDFFQSRGCRAFELTKGDFESGAIATAFCHSKVLARVSDATPQAAARKCALLVLDELKANPALVEGCDCERQEEQPTKRVRLNESK